MFVLIDGGSVGQVFRVWRGGYYYHGGLVGGIAGYIGYLWLTGNRIRDGLDWVAPFAALGEAVARIGCLLAGCCFGSVTQFTVAVVYPPQSHAWWRHVVTGGITKTSLWSMPVHPAPIYTVYVMLVLYVYLRWLQQRRRFPGQIALHYLTWHSISRIALEYFRDDMPQRTDGWTTTQTTAAGIAVAAAGILLWQYVKQFTHNPSRSDGAQALEDSS